MSKRLLHTPEGVRDIYGKEFRQKQILQQKLHETVELYGFQDIQTPTFEYFDIFSREIGTTSSKELYKFFDKEGDTLVLRPDFTPSIARCSAKYFMEEKQPIRLTYAGNTFTNTSSLQGKLKEVTQMGAELIGDGSVRADAEMVSLVIQALKNAGLKEFQISIGEVEYFRGICEEAGLDEDTEAELREYISNKNYFGAEALLMEKQTAPCHTEVLLKITEMFGSIEDLHKAREWVKNDRSIHAIERLSELYDLLCIYGVEDYVSFDLGMLNNYNYYTGVIFRAYTYGVGGAIVKGGRYDHLLGRFGKDAPAIGFMVVVDDLMSALSSQNLLPDTEGDVRILVYDKENFEEQLRSAMQLRGDGIKTELIPAQSNMDSKVLQDGEE